MWYRFHNGPGLHRDEEVAPGTPHLMVEEFFIEA